MIAKERLEYKASQNVVIWYSGRYGVISSNRHSYNSGAIGIRTYKIDTKYDNVSVNNFK